MVTYIQPYETKESSCEITFEFKKLSRKRNFTACLKTNLGKKTPSELEITKLVHNLSKDHLDEKAMRILTASQILIEDIICGLESTITKLDKHMAEEIYQEY